ncbi:MAG: hypothetical protein ABI615_14240 [Chthoniobacterales bacterium]
MKTKTTRVSDLFSVRFVFVFAGAVLLLSGCADENQNPARLDSNSAQRNTSAIPWNRPQSWEGSTGFGGMVNQPGSGH